MECGNCPLALPCFAGRLYAGHTYGVLCPLCNQFTVVHLPGYETVHIQLKAQHTVLHCPERKLTEVQIYYWRTHQQDKVDRSIVGDGVFGAIPYSMCDPHPGYNDNSDVRINVVPCAVCEPQRYDKAVHIEKLE